MASPGGFIAVYGSCALCHKSLHKTQPKVLPCLHNYCKDCLETYIKNYESKGLFKCILCKHQMKLPAEGVKGLPENWCISGLIEKLSTSPTIHYCHACKMAPKCIDTEATFICVDCDDYLCDSCAESHCRTKLTTEHTILTIEDAKRPIYEEQIKSKQKVFCPQS